MKPLQYEWTRINRDVNGNSRYVLHFLNIADDYETAVKLANKVGGRKYHTKGYGGGIVFQSCSLHHTEAAIERVREEAKGGDQ